MVSAIEHPASLRFPDWRAHAPLGTLLWIDVAAQRLWCMDGFQAVALMPCSTAAAGLGEREGSYRTPRGWHEIAALHGEGLPLGAVLRARQPTGDVWPDTVDAGPDDDLILTRILRLAGREPGLNRGGDRDSWDRFIYLHGTNRPEDLGRPASHGCIRLGCADVVRLHERVSLGHPVWIG